LAAGGLGYKDDNLVEYDMDAEDDKWLAAINGDQDRLPPARFELMIWRLETSNAAAIERTFAAAGVLNGERGDIPAKCHRYQAERQRGMAHWGCVSSIAPHD